MNREWSYSISPHDLLSYYYYGDEKHKRWNFSQIYYMGLFALNDAEYDRVLSLTDEIIHHEVYFGDRLQGHLFSIDSEYVDESVQEEYDYMYDRLIEIFDIMIDAMSRYFSDVFSVDKREGEDYRVDVTWKQLPKPFDRCEWQGFDVMFDVMSYLFIMHNDDRSFPCDIREIIELKEVFKYRNELKPDMRDLKDKDIFEKKQVGEHTRTDFCENCGLCCIYAHTYSNKFLCKHCGSKGCRLGDSSLKERYPECMSYTCQGDISYWINQAFEAYMSDAYNYDFEKRGTGGTVGYCKDGVDTFYFDSYQRQFNSYVERVKNKLKELDMNSILLRNDISQISGNEQAFCDVIKLFRKNGLHLSNVYIKRGCYFLWRLEWDE